MPEETWTVHGGIPACDLCHSRKVKCDRQDPCKNCVSSNVRCLHTRQKRTPQPRPRTDEKIKALVDKLASLEHVVRQTTPLSQSSNLARASSSTPRSAEDLSPRPLKRKRADGIERIEIASPCNSAAPQLQQGSAAREHIAKELSHNESLALHQRSVFETALAFIDQLTQAPPNVDYNGPDYLTTPTNMTKGELVQLLLASQQKHYSKSDMQLLMLDHIPLKGLERMTMMLLDATADECTLNMCKVVVHFKAALHLYANQLHDPKDAKTRKYVQGLQLHHLNAALTALSAVSFLTPPSLLLLQTLLTGAILMYIVGNSSTSWTLTAYASRTLIALNYHNINTTHPPEQQQEIQTAVAWCYHMDRLMSLLLLRHPSLPPLPVPVASLVDVDAAGNPMAVFALVMLQFVEVHEGILDLSLKEQGRKIEVREAEARVADLRARMDAIYRMIDEARTTNTTAATAAPSADYLLHWHSLEFKFYSTLTAVHRLSSNINYLVSEREKCLYTARQALQCVKSIHDLSKQQDHFLEEYNPYLAWTLLSYPLSPFFVLFCNVVGTSNAADFLLLQDVVDSITSLVAENRYVEKLRRLCSALLGLCRPLVPQTLREARPVAVHERKEAGCHDGGALAVLGSGASAGGGEGSALPFGGTGTGWESVGGAGGTEKAEALLDDEMMRQLFQCQPSLDWFNSDIFGLDKWELD